MNIQEKVIAAAKQHAQQVYEGKVEAYIANADIEFSELTRGKQRSDFEYAEREALLQKLLASAVQAAHTPDPYGYGRRRRIRLNIALEGERRLNEQSLSTTTSDLSGVLSNFAEAAE